MPLKRKRQKQNKVDVVKDFIEIAGNALEKRFGLQPTCKDVVRHFVERGIIEPKRLRNFMIIVDFDRMLVTNKGSRTHRIYRRRDPEIFFSMGPFVKTRQGN